MNAKDMHSLVGGDMPEPWQSCFFWLDMRAGQSVDVGNHTIFSCALNRMVGSADLQLVCSLKGSGVDMTTPLGECLDLSLITGFPCLMIPRKIKTQRGDACLCSPVVQLEFAILCV